VPDTIALRRMKIIFLSILALWITGFLSPLFAPHSAVYAVLYPFIRQMYHIGCHQVSEKCISVSGIHLLVCGRCAGIYFGLLCGFLVSFLTPRLRTGARSSYYFLYIIPVALDVFAHNAGIYHYSITIALTTGFVLGSGISHFIVSSIESRVYEK
jgi:uncharacterized membrane protein